MSTAQVLVFFVDREHTTRCWARPAVHIVQLTLLTPIVEALLIRLAKVARQDTLRPLAHLYVPFVQREATSTAQEFVLFVNRNVVWLLKAGRRWEKPLQSLLTVLLLVVIV